MNDCISASLPAKHLLQIFHNSVRSFPRRKVPAPVIFTRQHQRTQSLIPQLRKLHQLLCKFGGAQLDVRDELGHLGTVACRLVLGLVVDALAGCRPGGGEPVDGDPGQDLVVGPCVAVGPVVEFLVDPGEEADRAVGHAVANCLGFRRLLLVVAGAFRHEPFAVFVAGIFSVR